MGLRAGDAAISLSNLLRDRLAKASPFWFTLVAGSAGFCAYFSMYAFRKPFSAATYAHVDGWDLAIDYKIALVIAQVLGYALSKLIGIKVVSEVSPGRRAGMIVALILLAWVSLIGFALIPAPWNVLAMFLNGLPLGMIWGLVFGYVEGRRTSEVLGAILCASFIVSSGAVKSAGKYLMSQWHVSAYWMPAVTGALFLPLLFASVWVLSILPPPSPQDEAERVRRVPMDARARASFLADYGLGIALLVGAYILATAIRDFRDNFAAEIWQAVGYGDAAAIFTASEVPVAVLALAVLGLIIAVRDNLRALLVIHAIVVAGLLILGGSTLAFQAGLLGPVTWMVASGAGLYMAYTPFNAMLFDRLIAVSGRAGTAGFLIYVADASGYAGSCGLLLWRNFGLTARPWLDVYVRSVYIACVLGVVLVAGSAVYFFRRAARGR